ncbi:ABC-2 type transport system ATP-binding protein [Pedobacter steynii]|uniref:ABC-2 type transport system ATP-binding protein n=1 Tax=Pedobacter steynii TaxID=430522 RepID=A0A1G9K2F7_9SPHI|nr:ABC transporter ATP-binding protein [Pedobacter steynii]NQX38427.1 ABC transporter ATP-binding protein [Pedobacter steynii]SDL43918.1 ABC-2 type transport system ATP-binding protein [Pedobacter steynii]
MNDSVVEVIGLSHRYSEQWAISNISFEVKRNGIMGLLGSNGAGKSTTMNIICGALNPTVGQVFINGVDLRKHPEEAKRFLGFLPQKAPLFLDLTVDEYLNHCAVLRSVPSNSIKNAIEDAKARCGISHFSKRLIGNLSGGYQQRVGIAQAIVHSPKFVVLDEPTNGLDPNQIVEVRKLIKEIAEERAVLLSTHILSEVQATCDEIRMVEGGKMVFAGSMMEFDNYIEPDSFLVSMYSAPSMNELSAVSNNITSVEKVGIESFRIRYLGSNAVVNSFLQLSVLGDWGLYELKIEKSSLDEIFAKLSKQTENK